MSEYLCSTRLPASLRNIIACAVLLVIPAVCGASTAEIYMRDADDMYSRGEYDAAEIQLKNVLLLAPDDAQAYLLLGKVHLETGDAATAEKEIGRARDLGLDASEWLAPLARVYLALRRYDDVIALQTLDGAYPTRLQAEILQLQGQAYMAKQQVVEATEKFTAALTLDPDSIEAMLGKANIDTQNGNVDSASVLVNRVLAIEPDNTIALTRKGELLMKAGNMREALAVFQKAIAAEPRNLTAAVRRAAALNVLGDYEAVVAETNDLLSRQPGLYAARYLNALALFQLQQLEQAQQSIQKVVKAVPAHMPSQSLAGVIAFRLGQFDRAERHLRICRDQAPGNSAVSKLLGATLLKLGRPDQACMVLETDVPAAREDAQYLALLGTSCISAGEAGRGLEYLERAVELAPDIAAIRTQLALGQLALGATDEGVSELQGAVDLGQDLLQADVLLVMVYLQKRDFDRALAAAEALSGKLPESPVPRNLVGTALLGRGDHGAARNAFEHALRIQPDFLPARLNLAKLDMLDGDNDAARARFREVLSRDEDNLEALLALAALAGREQQAEEQVRWLTQAHDRHPDAIQPVLLLVQHYLRAGNTRQAEKLAMELQQTHPTDPGALRAVGQTHLAAGKYQQALVTLRSLVKAVPRSAEAHYLLAMAQARLQDTQGTRESLRQAIALQADYPAAQFALGKLHIVKKDYTAALAMADTLHTNHPDMAHADELRGDVYAARREYKLAEEAYVRAWDRAASAQLAEKLFRVRTHAGENEAARGILAEWLAEYPADVVTRNHLAAALLSAGYHAQAIEVYLEVLQYDPDNVQALNNLAWLYHEQGSQEGLKYAERAYELVPERPEVIDTLGWLELQHGRPNRGLLLLQEAVAKAPRNPEIRYHMAVALEMSGQRDEALAELDRLLETQVNFPDRTKAQQLRERLR